MRRKQYYKPYGGRRRKPWVVGLACLAAVAAACFLLLELFIAVHARTALVGEPETMVIFGCKVETWGPSIMLQDRLDAALAYLEDHPDMTVVVTGGKGDDEHVSEARAMYDYLTERGVDGEKILMEDRSRNTWQNVNYTFELLEKEGRELTGDVVLVSSGFHLARIRMLWDRGREALLWDEVYNDQYVSTVAAPMTHVPSAIQMFFREPLALVKSFLFDR